MSSSLLPSLLYFLDPFLSHSCDWFVRSFFLPDCKVLTSINVDVRLFVPSVIPSFVCLFVLRSFLRSFVPFFLHSSFLRLLIVSFVLLFLLSSFPLFFPSYHSSTCFPCVLPELSLLITDFNFLRSPPLHCCYDTTRKFF